MKGSSDVDEDTVCHRDVGIHVASGRSNLLDMGQCLYAYPLPLLPVHVAAHRGLLIQHRPAPLSTTPIVHQQGTFGLRWGFLLSRHVLRLIALLHHDIVESVAAWGKRRA